MSSLRQIEANRRNSQESTGPTSVTGKAVSSMNALKTGIHAKSLILPTEDRSELDRLTAEYYQHYRPASPKARVLLDEIVYCEWTLRRLRVAETQLWLYGHQAVYKPDDKFPLGQSCMKDARQFNQLQWRVDSTRRALHRNFQALEQLQAAVPNPTPDPALAPAPAQGQPALDPPSLSPSPHTTSPQIGFVPSTPISSLPQAPQAPVPGARWPGAAPREAMCLTSECSDLILNCNK
jgi:hypothetical protein